MGIKNFSPKHASLYEYAWDFVVYMVITGKKGSGLDIWLEIPNQITRSKDMILRI